MANRLTWLADETKFPNVTDGYTIRELDGNPVGLPHNTQISGSNVRILNSNDVKFGWNSLATATANSAKIQAIIDAAPDSGIAIGIPHDIALTTITMPTRTIRGIAGQPIACEIFGTRPAVQIYGMSTEPVFKLVPGASGVVHTASRTTLQKIRDLNIACRGTGIDITGGFYFTADNVVIRTDGTGPAWRFKDCYGMHLGNVGAFNGRNGIGFLFDYCIHVSFGHLWARKNLIGVKVLNTPNLTENSVGRSGNFFGTWDVEGNFDWQLDLDSLQKSSIGLYMEGTKRISLKNCENLEFTGDGFRVDYADASSLLLNPKIFQTQLNRVTPGGVSKSYNPSTPTLTITGPNAWTYSWTEANDGHWVNPADTLWEFNPSGKVMTVRFKAKGTGAGAVIARLQWNMGYTSWQSVDIRPSDDWVEYETELYTAPNPDPAVSNMYVTGYAGTNLEFELMHIAYVTRKTNYTV